MNNKFKKNLTQILNSRTKRKTSTLEDISISKLSGKVKVRRCLQSNTKNNLSVNTVRNKKIRWVCINLINTLRIDFLLMLMIQDSTTCCKTWKIKMRTFNDFYKRTQWIHFLKFNLSDINCSFKDITIQS